MKHLILNKHKWIIILVFLAGMIIIQSNGQIFKNLSAQEDNTGDFQFKAMANLLHKEYKEKKQDLAIFPSISAEEAGKGLTVLLIGMDNRPQEKYLGNTDTIMLARIDYEKKRISVLSIPRDTQIYIPGHGLAKINAAARVKNSYRGTVQAVEDLLGQKIDGYATINFDGFKNIIDTLGGITVNVDKDMYYDTGDKEDGIIDLKKGKQLLNGKQALQYARFRYDPLGDITRVGRQQEVIKAVFAKLRQPANLIKIPFLIPNIYAMTNTDINLGQMWSIGKLLTSEDIEISSQTLEGEFATEKGVSYWKVSPDMCRKAVQALFQGVKAEQVASPSVP